MSDPGVTSFKTSSTRETISRRGDGTNVEPMYTILPYLTGKVKVGHGDRTYVGKTRSIP